MLYSYEQIELMKLMQQENARKHRHTWGFYQNKNDKKNEGK